MRALAVRGPSQRIDRVALAMLAPGSDVLRSPGSSPIGGADMALPFRAAPPGAGRLCLLLMSSNRVNAVEVATALARDGSSGSASDARVDERDGEITRGEDAELGAVGVFDVPAVGPAL
jgi:hypothetical protein